MKLLADYFDLSKREQRSMFLLAGVVLITLVIRICLPVVGMNQEEWSQLERKKLRLVKQLQANIHKADEVKATAKENELVKLFFFDPNTANESMFRDLGFKEYQIKNIVNYRNAGGKFFKPIDIKNLYSVKNTNYQKYLPYIRISGVGEPGARAILRVSLDSASSNQLTDLNAADTSALVKLKGIGPYFARKIVEYRNRLGGFVSADQLIEIFRFTPTMLEAVRPFIIVDERQVVGININKVSVEELAKHPYVSWKVAQAIVKYREQHGSYTAIKEISNSVLIGDSLCRKIAPYFKIDD